MRRNVRWHRFAVPVLCLFLLPAQPASAAGDAASGVEQSRRAVQDLRRQVAAVGEELAAAAASYEQGQERLDRLRQLESMSDVDVENRTRVMQQAQRRLDALARGAYQQSGDPRISALLRGDLRAMSDYGYVQGQLDGVAGEQRDVVRVLAEARWDAAQLEEQRSGARARAQLLQAQLDEELARVQAVALARQTELSQASAALLRAEATQAEERRQAEAARLNAQLAEQERTRLAVGAPWLAGGAPGTTRAPGAPGVVVGCTGSFQDVVNGFLPPGALCGLSAAGQQLAYRAAPAFEAMTAAYAQSFGAPLCVTDSYRDYAGQVDVFRRKPALAATPGRSQHGWGLAVDLCGGVESFGTAQHQWMKQNAGRYGFVHPGWAQPGGSRPEPWHWEFRPVG